MRLVQVTHQPVVKNRPIRNRRKRLLTICVAVLLIMSIQLLRPLPEATITLSLPPLPQSITAELDWPTSGQASVAAEGYGVLGLYGSNQPLATASIAKVITALCILEKYPLQDDAQGPELTMSSQDVGFYQDQIDQNGSRLPIAEGQKLTERQALEAVMIPSANNIADSLALWAFGSHEAYATYANQYLARNGLVRTRVGIDASGFDPSSESTAEDLAKLGLVARKNSVLMQIASQKNAQFGELGLYANYNTALGTYGINGLKTGNNDQNPGALLYTADLLVGKQTVKLTGAVMGSDSLDGAIHSSQALVASLAANFIPTTYLRSGQIVGTARTAWGSTASVRAHGAVELIRWKASATSEKHTLHPGRGTTMGSVGALAFHAGEVQASTTLEITQPADGPSVWWRLLRTR